MKKILNVEYVCIQGTYWMYFGAICNFASVFLLAKGYSNSEIGITLAVSNVLAVVLQPVIADLADRARRFSLIAITEIITVMMMAATAWLLVINGKTMALTVIFVLLIAWHMVLQPLFNSLAFRLSEAGTPVNFGFARSMGSLLYAIFTAIFGVVVERCGILSIPVTGEAVLVMLLVSLALAKRSFDRAKRAEDRVSGHGEEGCVQAGDRNAEAYGRWAETDDCYDQADGRSGAVVARTTAGGGVLPEAAALRDAGEQNASIVPKSVAADDVMLETSNIAADTAAPDCGKSDSDKLDCGEPPISLLQFTKRHRYFFLVNLGVLGLYFGNAVFNNYMAQIVDSVGGGSGDMGIIFCISALCEIPFMASISLLRKKFSCQLLLKAASIGFLLKTGACALASSVQMVIAAHLFQLIGFGLFLPAMVLFIDETMRRAEAVKGQALFTTMVAVATVFSSLAGGMILDLSGAKALLAIATVVTAAGAAIIIATIDKVKKKGAENDMK